MSEPEIEMKPRRVYGPDVRKDLTEIVMLVDRSGSMQSCRADAEGGVNAFIEAQGKLEGDANLTLVQFDTVEEFVYKGAPIRDVGKYTLVPRGETALLDAIGRALQETKDRLDKLVDGKPGLVVFVIVTDGGENSSQNFNREQIKALITRQQNDNWQFNYLGANQDAFTVAQNMGVAASGVAAYNVANVGDTFKAASNSVGRMRGQTMRAVSLDNSYTGAEISSMVAPNSTKKPSEKAWDLTPGKDLKSSK